MALEEFNFPHGFVLSESALYAFTVQDVYPDILSFAIAIPDHLKPLFLIPIQMQTITASKIRRVAALVAQRRFADLTAPDSLPTGSGTPTGHTPEGDLFGTKTFVNEDNEPTVPSSDEGSIFEMNDADSLTHHQEYDYDCITPDTLVESKRGVIPANSIVIGDYMKNHLSSYSRVDHVWKRSVRKDERVFEIEIGGMCGAKPKVSDNHPLLVMSNDCHPKFIRAKDIKIGDYIGYPIPVFDKIYIKKIDLAEYVDNVATDDYLYIDHINSSTPHMYEYLVSRGSTALKSECLQLSEVSEEVANNHYHSARAAIRNGRNVRRINRYIPIDEDLAWIIGLYLAEGCTSKKHVSFALHKDEQSFIEKLDHFFSTRFNTNGYTVHESENGISRVYSSIIASKFFKSLCPGTAVNKRVPDLFKKSNDRRLAALIRGLIDGDGCYHESNKYATIDYVSISLQLASDVREILLSVGIPASFTKTPSRKVTVKGKSILAEPAYKVAVHCSNSRNLLAWLNDEPRPPTKSYFSFFSDTHIWSKVRKINSIQENEVIGFQMDQGVNVILDNDHESHGTFCLMGVATANSNIQTPTDTSYMTDVDMSEYFDYPYRTKESPVRHSSVKIRPVIIARLNIALKPEDLESRTPDKIKKNAARCSVKLVSYDKGKRIFNFATNCGNGQHMVQAAMNEIDHVALSCDCPFWRWNGPEFHAKENSYQLGQPAGTAADPNVRDPDRQYFLCKHTYAVMKRMDEFVQEVVDENWDKDESELVDEVDKDWDRLEVVAEIPLEDLEEDDVEIETDWDGKEEIEEDEAEVEEPSEDEELEEELKSEEPSEEELESFGNYDVLDVEEPDEELEIPKPEVVEKEDEIGDEELDDFDKEIGDEEPESVKEEELEEESEEDYSDEEPEDE